MILQFVKDTNPHYGLRKLSIGVASVLLGTVFAINENVHADTVNNQQANTNQQQNNESINQLYQAQNEQSSQLNAVTVKQNQNATNGMPNPINNNNTTQVLNLGKPESTNQIQINPETLSESKAVSITTNGGFDQATWGTLDVSKWQGQYYDGYYKLTNYTGDLNHIIIPNQADFQKAGRNVGQVGIDRILTHSWFLNGKSPISIAFSKTNGKTVKALGQDFDSAFSGTVSYIDSEKGDLDLSIDKKYNLKDFDGTNLDTSNVTSINYLFAHDQLSDISSLSTWKTSKIVSMTSTFEQNRDISDLSALSNWDVSKVQYFSHTFDNNQGFVIVDNPKDHGNIFDLLPLKNWNTESATDISYMFAGNKLTDLTPLAKWKINNAKNINSLFMQNYIKTLKGLENWQVSSITEFEYAFANNKISDISSIANWNMSSAQVIDGIFSYNSINDISSLEKWDVSKINNFSYAFSENKIKSLLPLSKWNTQSATNINDMFSYNELTTLNGLENWNTSNITDFESAFKNNQINNLNALKNWNTSKATDMNGMFDTNQINNLNPISKWNISKVINFGAMFLTNKIQSLKPVSTWINNSSQATNLSFMFSGNEITDLSPVRNWNLSKITDASYLFANNKITDLEPISTWNTSNIKHFDSMFYWNKNLKNLLPIAHWNTNNAESFVNMFLEDPIQLADFRYWSFDKAPNGTKAEYDTGLHGLISQDNQNLKNAIILIKPQDFTKFTTPYNDLLNNKIYPLDTKPNSIGIDTTMISMPTIYTTTDTTAPAEQLAEQLVKQTRQQKLQDYAKQHNLDATKIQLITPDPTDHAYDAPVIMANQKYQTKIPHTITINFKDTNNQTILSVPTTNTEGTTQSIAALIPDGYIPYSGQNVPTKITFDAQNHTYDIVLTHRCLLIYPTDNYQANQIIPGTTTKKIPSSFNMNNLHKEITRIINITLPTGKKQQIIQSAQFARQAILDTVTGKITYQPWSYNGQYTLSSYLPQPIDGYNIQPIKKVVVTPTSKNMVENLQYQPNNYYAKIKYQTTNGKIIKLTDPIHINSAITVKLLAPTGYHLLANANQINLSAINENQTLNILVAPNNITYTANDQLPTAIKEPLAKTITRTIMITLPNGKIKTIQQQVKFTRTATINSDGTVTYNDWQATNRPQFNKIFLPKHHGYQLVITQDNQPLTTINKLNNVTAKTTDSSIIVKYIKQ